MTTQLFDLTGKVALITGASRGIGEATARLLAEQGAHVVISSRKQEDLDIVAASIIAAGGKATAIAAHQGESAALAHLMAEIEANLGRLDILVNNAATNPYFGHISDTSMSMVDKTMQVNIKGYFELAALASKLMKKGGGGAIVNIASINGLKPGMFQGIYSITKAAVINMTQAFAKECAPWGVRWQRRAAGAYRNEIRLGPDQERPADEAGAAADSGSVAQHNPPKSPRRSSIWWHRRRAT